MKSLEPNPLANNRESVERLVPIPFEDWDLIERVGPPHRSKWIDAPGMPYRDGLDQPRVGKVVEWTPEEREHLNKAQARGDRVTVARMMKDKQK